MAMAADKTNPAWPTTTIARSAYLKGRIGWQGLKAAEFLEDGPFLVTGTDFIKGKIGWQSCYHVSEARYAEASYIHLRNGDVLVTKDGTIGKIAFVEDCPEKAVLNSGIFLLRCRDGSFEQRYLYYLLQSEVFRRFLDDNLAGSTIQHLYQHIFKTFEFPVPESDEQMEIARVLSTVDRAIKETEALVEKEQCIKTGLMQDLLTRGIDEEGAVRSEDTHKFKNSPIGSLPAQWKVGHLRDLASVIDPQPDHRTPAEVRDGIPYIGLSDFNDDETINFGAARKIAPEAYNRQAKAFSIAEGAFIFGKIGTIGFPRRIPHQRKYALSANVILINPIETPSFVYWWMESPIAKRLVDLQLHTTSQPAFGIQKMRTFSVPMPSKDERERIGAILDKIGSAISAERTLLTKLRMLKAGLTQDLLTGQRRVTPLLKATHLFAGQGA
jgi:type I restriction enzyme, S subunit